MVITLTMAATQTWMQPLRSSRLMNRVTQRWLMVQAAITVGCLPACSASENTERPRLTRAVRHILNLSVLGRTANGIGSPSLLSRGSFRLPSAHFGAAGQRTGDPRKLQKVKQDGRSGSDRWRRMVMMFLMHFCSWAARLLGAVKPSISCKRSDNLQPSQHGMIRKL